MDPDTFQREDAKVRGRDRPKTPRCASQCRRRPSSKSSPCQGKDVYLGVFNWSDAPKEYALAAFGKSEPVTLAAHHSVILKYLGKDSFAQLCQKLQSN